MPLYEYRCTQCGHGFEKIQSFSATPETACPECGGALERPLTAPALQFKGAGWYVNDYASKSSSSKTDSNKTDKAGGDSTSPSGGESKPSTESKPATESKSASSDSASKPASTSTTSSTS